MISFQSTVEETDDGADAQVEDMAAVWWYRARQTGAFSGEY